MSAKLDILYGKIVKDNERFIDVELFHVKPKRIIKNVVKLFPLDCDEREEECNIKEGIEVCILLTNVSGHENAVCLGSSNQGIKLGGRGISKIENLEEVQIISKVIKLHDNAGKRDKINSNKKLAEKILGDTKKFAVSNDADEIIDILVKTQEQLADLAKAFAVHLTSGTLPHDKMPTGGLIYAKVKILKEKLESFRVENKGW
jgi:hypothetical protein